MAKARERQLRCARPAPDRLLRFDDANGAPGFSKRHRGGQAIRPRPDDDRV